MRAISIAKIDEGLVNEDAGIAKDCLIAVSDGAGGGGVFADRWSKYLVEHLPDNPILDFGTFDSWIDGIWEPFYTDCEAMAKAEGGMLLNKFYDEGSFATLVAVWKSGQWISYGDSVAFCFNRQTKELTHSFTRLVDFNNPPYLVNCKDPLNEKGFCKGTFDENGHCIIFATSDALAHYILMMYEIAHRERYEDELQEAISAQTKDSNYINSAMSMKQFEFEKDVLGKLLSSYKNKANFMRHLKYLRKNGLLAHDDYTFVIMD